MPGVQPLLLREGGAVGTRRGEGVGLPSRAVQGQDQVAVELLPDRVGGRLGGQLVEQVAVASGGELGLRQALVGRQPPVVPEVPDSGDVGGVDVLEGFAVPQSQRPAQLSGRHQVGELLGVHLPRRRVRDVAAGARLQQLPAARAAQHLAYRGDGGVDLRSGGVRLVVAPHRLDQALDADHPSGVEQQVGQDRAVTWGDARQRRLVDDHLDGPEKREPQHCPP
nr:hypothetical protein GCM10020093_069770 [Planobispora longispora]